MAQLDYNVDIVDIATGEIYAESLDLGTAHSKIFNEGWTHVETTSEELPSDGCTADSESHTLYTIWVNTGIDLASEEEMRRRSAAWWGYQTSEVGGGQNA